MILKPITCKAKEYLLKVIKAKTTLIPPGASQVGLSNFSNAGNSVNNILYFHLLYRYMNKVVKLPLVLKIYESTEMHKKKCEKSFKIMNYLKAANFLVPQQYFMENNENPLGGPFVIMEMIEGQTMSSYVKRHRKQEVYTLLDQLAASCVFLHNLDLKGIAETVLAKPKDEYSYARESSLIQYTVDYAKSWDYEWITRWLKLNAEKCPCKTYSLLHFDMNFRNFLVTESNKIFFIDWEWAEIGDALRDVASAYHEIEHILGDQAAVFFEKQYAKHSNNQFDSFKLLFYHTVAGFNLILYFRYLTSRQLGTWRYLTKIFGMKCLPIIPIVRWHFSRRCKYLETCIRKEISEYEDLMFNTSGGKTLSQIEKDAVEVYRCLFFRPYLRHRHRVRKNCPRYNIKDTN